VLVATQHVLVGLTMKVGFFNNLGVNMRQFFKFFQRDERGVTALEYAILAGIIVVALVAVGGTFSSALQGIFTQLTTKVSSTITGSTGS
jgi:pilus assembly protein Flp/PilA